MCNHAFILVLQSFTLETHFLSMDRNRFSYMDQNCTTHAQIVLSGTYNHVRYATLFIFCLKTSIFLNFNSCVTDGRTDRPTDRPTDGRTDTPSYRDARTHLKRQTEMKARHGNKQEALRMTFIRRWTRIDSLDTYLHTYLHTWTNHKHTETCGQKEKTSKRVTNSHLKPM